MRPEVPLSRHCGFPPVGAIWRHGRDAGARENRAFLGRAVRYLLREAGMRQFLGIGGEEALTSLTRQNEKHG